MKIVILDGYTLNNGDLSWDPIASQGDIQIYDRTPAAKIVERIGDAEIVFTNKTPLSADTMNKCANIKYIGLLATGYNVVDVEAAQSKDIVVTNIPTYGTTAVAQFAIALLLELCHRVGAHADSVKAGEWSKREDFCYWLHPLVELAGKTMGIIGFGRIGQATAKIALALGMKVIAYDKYQNKELETDNLRYASLDDVICNADVLSLHCPLTSDTEGIINKKTIARMKPGVFLVNTSRGPLVVENDLREALDSGKIAGAAVDVVSREPIDPQNPLLKAKNCLITPHIAWAPKESRQRLMDIAADNLRQFINGKPVNVVKTLFR